MRFLTAGESHGKGLVVIIEGIPAGLHLDEGYIASHLARRQCGYGRGERMDIEEDRAEILSGVRHGLTIGSPLSLLILNLDWEKWQQIMSTSPVEQEVEPLTQLRPGHADLAGAIKYGLDDVRPILERASARETASRVAAGAVARRLLGELGIEIHSYTVCIGGCWSKRIEPIDWSIVEKSPVRCIDSETERIMMFGVDPDQVYYSDEEIALDRTMGIVFWSKLTEKGIIILPDGRWFVSAAITDEDIDRALEASDEALGEMA